MLHENEIEMSTNPIAMPPLDQAEPAFEVDNDVPTEIQQAQEQQRQLDASQKEQPIVSAKEKDSNIIILRKMADQAARERDDLARRLAEYEAKQPRFQEEEFSIKEDDLVEGKHLAQAMKKIKNLEDQQKQYLKQNTEVAAEMKLRNQYPDFDKVMTLENVQMLSASYPELAKSINAAPDLYDKASSAYTLIKKFGIYNDVPHDADKQRALANAAKPRPLASVSPQQGESPLSRANAFSEGLTDSLKEQLRKEMEAARKLY